MPYVAPTPADLKALLPDFAALPDATVQAWLTQAGTSVDQSWSDTDYTYAIMLLAAHLMVLNGIVKIGDTGLPEGVTDFRSGSFSVAIDRDVAKATASSGYEATKFGRQFAQLLARNKGGPRVTGGCAMPVSTGYNGWAGPLPDWIGL